MPHQKKRRKIVTSDAIASSMGPKDAVDFFVPLADPSTCSTLTAKQTTLAVLNHLKKCGYVKCALTHTVYGRPKDPEDLANNAIPKSIYASASITVLRRLHVIVETLADIGLFASGAQSPIANILKEYDIISLAPRNAAALDAACRTEVDIVSMDYHSMHSVPFRWKRHEIRLLVRNGTRFEIPYAPALLDAKARRNLMILCSDAVTKAPNILLSSGPRISNGDDVGPQALRRPGDMLNFAHVIMGLVAHSLANALRGNLVRRTTQPDSAARIKVSKIQVITTCNYSPSEAQLKGTKSQAVQIDVADDTKTSTNKRVREEEDSVDDDGFIAL